MSSANDMQHDPNAHLRLPLWQEMIRDAPLGQFVRLVSKNRLLPYKDEMPGYVIPEKYLAGKSTTTEKCENGTASKSDSSRGPETDPALQPVAEMNELIAQSDNPEHSKFMDKAEARGDLDDPNLVTWDGYDDPDRPKNWSSSRKRFIIFVYTLATFSVYGGGAMYPYCVTSLMEYFNIDYPKAQAGLGLFILGYGIGPMLLTPAQDHYILGRNTVYIASLVISTLCQGIMCAMENYANVVGLRFMVGFFGSIWLATPGGSIDDLEIDPKYYFYALAIWDCGAALGPSAGPIIVSYAGMIMGWRWPLLILLWLLGISLALALVTLPETLHSTLLHRKTLRLRKLTGNPSLRSLGEIESAAQPLSHIVKQQLWLPFAMCAEPVIAYANFYMGLVYALFYLWFESFPLVFNDIYKFNDGEQGLVFCGFLFFGAVCVAFYFWYIKARILPNIKLFSQKTELFLDLALVGSCILPISLFIFGWTSWRNVHWFGAAFGASTFNAAFELLFLGMYPYLIYSFPRYGHIVLAGNGLFRSLFAFSFPFYGRVFFQVVSVPGGCSMLGGCTIVLAGVMLYFRIYGQKLREKSKYAH